MPQRVDDNTMLILNMIYERQIMRVFDVFFTKDQVQSLSETLNRDLFVLSASDPNVFLDYASISVLNCTLETILDPNDL
jgi:hypothetical protein